MSRRHSKDILSFSFCFSLLQWYMLEQDVWMETFLCVANGGVAIFVIRRRHRCFVKVALLLVCQFTRDFSGKNQPYYIHSIQHHHLTIQFTHKQYMHTRLYQWICSTYTNSIWYVCECVQLKQLVYNQKYKNKAGKICHWTGAKQFSKLLAFTHTDRQWFAPEYIGH